MKPFVKSTQAHLLRTLLTGALAVLPLLATLMLVGWVISLLARFLGPGSAVGAVLGSLGLRVTESEGLAYALGLGLALLLIYLLGLVVETQLQRRVKQALEGLINRIPVISTVYDLLSRMVELMAKRDAQGTGAMTPVWCHFGGPKPAGSEGGARVLGLLSTPEPVLLEGQPYLAVILPTAPVPVGGGLLYLPQRWVTPADVGVEGLSSLYLSLGVTSAEVLGKKAATVPQADPPA